MPRSNSGSSLDDVSSQASYDSDEDFRLAQQEWEESLRQLQQLVSIVLLPFSESGLVGDGVNGLLPVLKTRLG